MQARNRLCEHGFSFEYSATFGQAMKASGNRKLEQDYAKCILFDYSYRYFYRDGFGKDYRILNLADDSDEDKRRLYMTACLLAFYQQQRLYHDHPADFRPFLLEQPLWIFVGGSVNAVRSKNRRKVSDVLDGGASTINILIGSKKFTEGWNSWRVSTMGLMNIGNTEGSEIIQLFGRGVRLKGHAMSLKRSSVLDDVDRPQHIGLLETLNIFGIRADYMRQFKEYLEEEGLPSNEDRIPIILPVLKNFGGKKLTTIKLKDGVDFKRLGPKPTLAEPPELLLRHRVTLNWYPKIQAQQSRELQATADIAGWTSAVSRTSTWRSWTSTRCTSSCWPSRTSGRGTISTCRPRSS